MILVLSLIVVLLILAILYIISRGKNKDTYKAYQDAIPDLGKDFSVGKIEKVKKCEYANQCDKNVLYPITGLEVDYGSKFPDGCKCTQFIQSP